MAILAAATQRETGDGGNDRLLPLADPVPGAELVVHIGVGIAPRLQLLDVGSCREGLLRPGDDDAADGLVLLERIERLVDLADKLAVERIQRLRPIERD